ncbi:MAG: hypothetical protein OEZ01_04160 [Candidatus Heimdallarchaeota archaeon]|nr:hypothetical protein [Candidatus Heimdallarchaeota archaeon]MDH5645174.1 hypothetical protein [Candidatus Heimdallarchaeota archaeon]
MFIKLTNDETDKVKNIIETLDQAFENWFNGISDINEFSSISNHLADEWIFINNQTPNIINSKNDFITMAPLFHGKHKNNPVKFSHDIKEQRKLCNNKVLLTYFEIISTKDETTSKPITMIINLDNLKVEYIHE